MAATTPLSADQAREQLRSGNQVRLISSDEEGQAFHAIPTGVYGFTYAPATETPVFARRSYHSYEVHKLNDGSGRLIGFCAAADAARVRTGKGDFEITACPDPWNDATELVVIPMDAITNSLYKLNRREGNAIPLRLSFG